MAFLVNHAVLGVTRGKGENPQSSAGAKKNTMGKKTGNSKSPRSAAQHSSDTEIVSFWIRPPSKTNGILGGFFTTCLKSMARRIASYNPSQEIIELKPPRIILPILLYGCFLKWWYPHFTSQNDHF